MKEAVLEVLASKSGISEKKLWKKVCKKLQIPYGDEESEGKKSEFESVLENLLVEKDLIKYNNEISLNKAKKTVPQSNNKRKAGLDSYNEFSNDNNIDEEEEAVGTVPLKKAKVDTSSKYVDLWKNGERYWKEGLFDSDYLASNPDRITRLFCGNLNKKITEEDLKSCLPGIKFIKWITDKQTGEFYGSTFLEMKDPEAAAAAVLKDQSKFMGRPLKIYYCPPRPGDRWPPRESSKPDPTPKPVETSESEFPKTPKPENCRKLFAGNLSYDIDDDTMVEFFKDCGTLVGLRWLTRKETGEFRGCAYLEFTNTEEADAAMQLDGNELLGRKIRLDWTS